MSVLSAEKLPAVAGGRWLRRPAGALDACGVGTDTRGDLRGRVFLALRGERFDGHRFLPEAAAGGAAAAIVDRPPPPGAAGEMPVLLVDDVRAALGQLARSHRRRLIGTKVIAVTGSVGKTTTQRLIHALLSTAWRGTAARRSFNNDLGVPLTLLAARPRDAYVVVEIGAGGPGEIARLARIVEPDLAVITSVGRAHLEGFGSVETVAREKASLLGYLRPRGVAVVNADAPYLDRYTRGAPSIVRFGAAHEAELRLTDRGPAAEAGRWWFQMNGRVRFDLALPGRHNAMNALAAVAVARRFGLEYGPMSRVLAEVEPAPGRFQVLPVPWSGAAPLAVYDDAYNANPDAMDAALEAFIEAAHEAPRRLLVLGDMLELGPGSAELHAGLGRAVIDVDSRRRLAGVFLIGPRIRAAAELLRRVWPPERVTALPELDEGAIATITAALRGGDALLVKGSRAMGLDHLVDVLKRGGARRARGSYAGEAVRRC